MKSIRSWVASLLGCGVLVGCGERPVPPTPDNATSAMAGANRRYPLKEEYKQVLGKNGQLNWKPGMRQPAPAAGSPPATPPK